MLPWLDPDLLEDFEGQPAIYDQIRFSSPSAQEIWLRSWVSNRQSASSSELSEDIQFSFTWYPGRFCPGIGSIIHDARPTAGGGSILDYLPTRYGDVAILEEPEHLSWSGFVLLLAVQRKYFEGCVSQVFHFSVTGTTTVADGAIITTGSLVLSTQIIWRTPYLRKKTLLAKQK